MNSFWDSIVLYLKHPLVEVIKPFLIGIFLAVIGLVIEKIALRRIAKLARDLKISVLILVLRELKGRVFFWILLVAIYSAIVSLKPSQNVLEIVKKVLIVIFAFSFLYTFAKIIKNMLEHYLFAKVDLPRTSILTNTILIIILIVGILIILDIIGLSITPILTALGVGGLAVALALQDTLANFFAGLYITIEKTIRIGDIVNIGGDQEGFVEDINWRTTRIRTFTNNLIIIPNQKLAQSIVTNYNLPEKRVLVRIPINVSYSSDPEKVEKILLEEVKKAIGEISGLLKEPEPVVRFIPGFGESSLDFLVICNVDSYENKGIVEHELRKRIFKRFQQEGIEIPFPHRVVYIRKENENK